MTSNEIKSKINNPFYALKSSTFSIYWVGMCISLTGTWMQSMALSWFAYTLTKSAFLLSLVGALQFLPTLFVFLFTGVIIDKFNKKKIILICQILFFLTSAILGFLIYSNTILYWHILVLATIQGFTNSLDMPARQAFLSRLVKKDSIMNAIALNSAAFNGARVIGPALAGIVMGKFGIAYCFFANSISYIPVIISLMIINPQENDNSDVKTEIVKQIKDGLKYISNNALIKKMLYATAIVSTLAMNFSVLVPVYAKTELLVGETGFGFLMSFMGIGTLAGSMFIAFTSKNGPKKFFVNVNPYIIGVLLIATSLSNYFFVLGIFLAITGFFFVTFNSTANSTLQLSTEENYKGRVMSIYNLAFTGLVPFGNVFAGAITNEYGPRIGFVACGIVVIIMFSILSIFNKIRHNGN